MRRVCGQTLGGGGGQLPPGLFKRPKKIIIPQQQQSSLLEETSIKYLHLHVCCWSPLIICSLSSSQVMKSVKGDTPGGSIHLYALYWIQKMTGVLIRCLHQLQTRPYMTTMKMKLKVPIPIWATLASFSLWSSKRYTCTYQGNLCCNPRPSDLLGLSRYSPSKVLLSLILIFPIVFCHQQTLPIWIYC